MIVQIDSREKAPLEFKHKYITDTIVHKLDVGDYRSIYENGKQSRIVIERKSIGDLYGTLTKGYGRFRKEIERAREANIYLVICIEGSYTKVGGGYSHSKRPAREIQEQLRTIWVKYGVTHTYCVTRKEMAKYIIDTFIWVGRKKLWV